MLGSVIVILIILLIANNPMVEKVKCRVCSWKGSKKLWHSHKGCPNCKTDEIPTLFREKKY